MDNGIGDQQNLGGKASEIERAELDVGNRQHKAGAVEKLLQLVQSVPPQEAFAIYQQVKQHDAAMNHAPLVAMKDGQLTLDCGLVNQVLAGESKGNENGLAKCVEANKVADKDPLLTKAENLVKLEDDLRTAILSHDKQRIQAALGLLSGSIQNFENMSPHDSNIVAGIIQDRDALAGKEPLLRQKQTNGKLDGGLEFDFEALSRLGLSPQDLE